jgi:inner membrane protein
MDNLCHTLASAALAESGLKRLTRYGTATLLIASNLPDVDALVVLTSVPRFAFRRGWTHGILAQALLPLALAALMWAIGRRWRRHDSTPTHVGWLLAFSYVGLLSHVFLDYLNDYGIRPFAPFDWRWFYGDALAVVDPFMWAFLGGGVWLARRRARPAYACGGLVCAACYVALMLVSAQTARTTVAAAWRESRGDHPTQAVVIPSLPLLPRTFVVESTDRYDVGTLTWWPSRVTFEPTGIPKRDTTPEVRAAREQSVRVRQFLMWSRLPFWTIEPSPYGTRVTLADLRLMSAPVDGAEFQASVVVGR